MFYKNMLNTMSVSAYDEKNRHGTVIKEMKRKILIGSILATLLLLSMPFVSTIHAQTVTSKGVRSSVQPSTAIKFFFTRTLIKEMKYTIDILLHNFGDNPKVINRCKRVTAILNSYNQNNADNNSTDCFALFEFTVFWAFLVGFLFHECVTGSKIACLFLITHGGALLSLIRLYKLECSNSETNSTSRMVAVTDGCPLCSGLQ